jgi:hypothetical protein
MPDEKIPQEQLAAEWLENEAAIRRLHEQPDLVGDQDPATRERLLLQRQDQIEFELGRRLYQPPQDESP